MLEIIAGVRAIDIHHDKPLKGSQSGIVSVSVSQLYHHPTDLCPLFDLTKRLYRQLTSDGFVFKDNTHRKVDRISC